MLELNHANAKLPQELRRLAVLADVDTKDLMVLTGLGESAINNYFNDNCTRQNYLFQFALEFLAEKNLTKLKHFDCNNHGPVMPIKRKERKPYRASPTTVFYCPKCKKEIEKNKQEPQQ